MIACVQTLGSLAHLHPHVHLLVTDGAYRRDGTFVPPPVPDPTGTRYAGAYATRRRIWWRRRGVTLARASGEPSGAVEREDT